MIILSSLAFFIIGFLGGIKIFKFLSDKEKSLEEKRKVDEINDIYKDLLNSLINGKVRFKTRVNQICHLISELEKKGKVEIVYFLDKKEVAIFKKGVCINTSELADKELISNISEFIETAFRKEINDVVNILGLIMSKTEFEKNFHIKVKDLQKLKESLNITDVEEILPEEKTYDVDEILDKISAYGITSLTFEERLFLDNYSNEKRN